MPYPNIVFITTDQHRFDAAPPHRPAWLRTPHLDDLAFKGFSFDSAYSTCPVCVASRCTIMTGQYEWTHGMTNNGHTCDVLDDQTTLPSRLRELGYQTQAVGKMHFGPARARHGFDDCLLASDYYHEMRSHGHAVQPNRHGLGQNEYYPGMATVPEALTLTNWIAEQSAHFIRERRDPTRPFFLWCSFGKPHPPFDPPEPYYSMYAHGYPLGEGVTDDWSEGESAPRHVRHRRYVEGTDLYPPELYRAIRAAYYGLVTQVDYNIGRVIGTLDDMGELANTLVVFTADHGEYLGDHCLMGKTLWLESCCRVPMIVRPPAGMLAEHRGRIFPHLVCLADLFPTFLGAAGGSVEDAEGLDMLGLVDGRVTPREMLEGMCAGHRTHGRGITDGRYKYLWFFEGGVPVLFDLHADPLETRNLAHDLSHAAICARLHAVLAARLAGRATDAELTENGRLRSLPADPLPEERSMRALRYLSYHTEYFADDAKH